MGCGVLGREVTNTHLATDTVPHTDTFKNIFVPNYMRRLTTIPISNPLGKEVD